MIHFHLNKEATNDLDRLCSALEASSISKDQFIEVLSKKNTYLDSFLHDKLSIKIYDPVHSNSKEFVSKKLPDKQRNYRGPICLSVFTGLPVILDMCYPFIKGAHVLNAGCGERYGVRELVKLGAKTTLGLVTSQEMIEKAKHNPLKTNLEIYEICDAETNMKGLLEDPASLRLIPGRIPNEGGFHLAVATSLFIFDGNVRGRLFDVFHKGLDMKADNVLFSVSRAPAPYHTDGASANKVYDVVGLLNINPASEGSDLHLSNVGDALAMLKQKLHKFILNELFRLLPRDILENGSGQGLSLELLEYI